MSMKTENIVNLMLYYMHGMYECEWPALHFMCVRAVRMSAWINILRFVRIECDICSTNQIARDTLRSQSKEKPKHKSVLASQHIFFIFVALPSVSNYNIVSYACFLSSTNYTLLTIPHSRTHKYALHVY